MRKISNRTRSLIAAAFAILFWSSAFPAVKFCSDYYSPGSIMLFRFAVAAAVLGIAGALGKTRLPAWRDMPMFALCGFLGIFLYMWGFNTGIVSVASGVSSFIIASSPVFTMLLSVLILREKVSPMMWAGVFISLAGLVMTAWEGANLLSGPGMGKGEIFLLGAAISGSFYTIFQRKLLAKYSPIQTTAYAVFFAVLLMLVFLPGLIREFPSAPLAANLVIVYLGVFPAALAYFLWGYALSKAGSTMTITVFLYLSPFSSTLIAYLWLNEVISVFSFIGGVVVIAGMAFINLTDAKSRAPSSRARGIGVGAGRE